MYHYHIINLGYIPPKLGYLNKQLIFYCIYLNKLDGHEGTRIYRVIQWYTCLRRNRIRNYFCVLTKRQLLSPVKLSQYNYKRTAAVEYNSWKMCEIKATNKGANLSICFDDGNANNDSRSVSLENIDRSSLPTHLACASVQHPGSCRSIAAPESPCLLRHHQYDNHSRHQAHAYWSGITLGPTN